MPTKRKLILSSVVLFGVPLYILILLCGLLVLLIRTDFVVESMANKHFCYPEFAEKHGIEPSELAVINYIENSFRSGMNSTEVENVLEEFGEILYIYPGEHSVDNRIIDEYTFDICPDIPFNTINNIAIYYNLDGELIKVITYKSVWDE